MSTAESRGRTNTGWRDGTPPAAPQPVAREVRLTPEALAAAFVREVPPVRVSPLYLVSLLVVAVVMLLMPVLYLALVALVGWGVYYHAVAHVPDFGSRRVNFVSVMVCVAPIIAGAIAVAFLLKPLLAPRRRQTEPLTVQPDEEPLLAQYVEMVCRAMNAPAPRRIDVDAMANASASFRRGLLSFFGNDLVLTLGLPLVAALDLRQLTGVLAHELGHFRQGLAMRLTYIIQRINGWFFRVVYERDGWDERLAAATHEQAFQPVILIVLLAQVCVWLSRQALKALMYVALGVSAFMSRQMEFDADRCEAAMAGSGAFGPTSRRIIELNAAWNAVAAQLQTRWAERRLPDDLPMFVAATAASLPAEEKERLVKEFAERRTGVFDTHPSMARRIAAAEKLEEPGAFTLEVPARGLFRDFRAICRRVTYIHYRAVVGQEIFQATLVPAEQIIRQQEEEAASGEAFKRFFPGPIGKVRPVFPEVLELSPPRNPKETLQDLRDAREELKRLLAELEARAERFERAAGRVIDLRIAREAVGAGLRASASSLGISKASVEAIKEEIPRAEQAREAAAAALEPVMAAARKRLVCALRLLLVSGIEKRLPEAEKYRDRIPVLLSTLGALKEAVPAMRGVQADLLALAMLLDHCRGNEKNEKYHNRVREVSLRLHRHVQSATSVMSATIYPYEHSRGTVSVAEVFRTGVISTPDHPVELAHNAGALLEGYAELYRRTLSELALMAERVERTLKLPPLELPAAKPKAEEGEKKKGKKDAERLPAAPM